MKKIIFALVFFAGYCLNVSAQSKVWVSDLGNGKYKNPVIYADYSDPDVCRVGDDFYLVASSFNCIPGLPILHSKDLVNWSVINYALKKQTPEDLFATPQHGNGAWAPSIRFHNGEYYIYFPDPDQGIFMTKSKDPAGEWSKPVLIMGGKGLIDPCPLWDDNGKAYMVHAFAGSRAGGKSVVAVFPLSEDGTTALGETRIVFDGHMNHPTMEGPKFYKRNGYYYIFTPAGGVPTGWQVVMRSKNVYGPYEDKIVLAQGKSNINGPHQGAWVDTQTGEDWFIHFQDLDAYGRVILLEPMMWKNDWPVMGVDKDGDGCGEPVETFKKPNVGKTYPVCTPVESDEFNANELGLQWQWHANAQPLWYFTDAAKGCLRLFSYYPQTAKYHNLWDAPNLLLQKFPAQEFKTTAKIKLTPDARYKGERCGLIVIGYDYALLSLENTDKGFILSNNICIDAEKGNKEETKSSVVLPNSEVYLRVEVNKGGKCQFSYSTDNKKYVSLGDIFTAKPGKWIGAKMGVFCARPKQMNDGGWADVDWFRVDK